MKHTHEFRRYILCYAPNWRTVQNFGVGDGWYVGYECLCGEQGYAVPA